MIHPSRRWRFIQEIEDQGYYEDEIVQHQVSEHRAIRRSYSEKFTQDEIATGEVIAQLRLAASCTPPALPIVYAVEITKDRLSYIMELVEGVEVVHLVRQKEFTRPRPWSSFAIKLVDELVLLRRTGARFERLPLEHLVIADNNELRIRQRFPVGPLDHELVARSRFLQRFEIIERGGVYTSTAPPNEAAELEAARDILLKAASANTANTFDELRQEVLANPERHSSPLARIDSSIAEFLFRINTGTGSADIRTLDQLRSRLQQFRSDAISAAADQTSTWNQPAAPPPPEAKPAKPAFTTDEPAANPFHHKPVAADYNVDESPAMPSFGGGAQTPPPKPARKKEPPPPLSPVDDDVNPFAMGAPPAPPSGGETTAKHPSGAHMPTPPRPRRSGPLVSPVMVRNLVVAIGVIGVVIALAVIVPPMLNRTPVDSTPPIAVISGSGTISARVNERVTLDASESRDETAATLSYYWQVISPAGGKGLFVEPGGGQVTETATFVTRSPRVIVQFLNSESYVVELKVNDGTLFSQPVTVTVAVGR